MMSRALKTNEAGFTLIEIIVVIGIFSILMVALLNLFDWHHKLFYVQQADTFATGSARDSMNQLTKYIAQGTVLQSYSVLGNTYTTDANTVVMQLPAFDSGGNSLASTYDYIAFDLNGTTLTQYLDAAGNSGRNDITRVLSEYVDTLTFTYDSGDVTQTTKITVDLVTEAQARSSGPVRTHVGGEIILRNR